MEASGKCIGPTRDLPSADCLRTGLTILKIGHPNDSLSRSLIAKLKGVSFLMRVKVKITCKTCGERFILRGKKERGEIETGFKQCLCDNRHYFDIEEDL